MTALEALRAVLALFDRRPERQDFITVRANGSASFDAAAYLCTPEGQAKINAIAADNRRAIELEGARDGR